MDWFRRKPREEDQADPNMRRDLTLARARLTATETVAFALLETVEEPKKSQLLDALRQSVVRLGSLHLPPGVPASEEQYYRNSVSQAMQQFIDVAAEKPEQPPPPQSN
jgi:hypothetical protein